MTCRFNRWVTIVSRIYDIGVKSILGTKTYDKVEVARAMLYHLCVMDGVPIFKYWTNHKIQMRWNYLDKSLNRKLLNWTYNLYK